MKSKSPTAAQRAGDATARVETISRLFKEMSDLLERWVAEAGPAKASTADAMRKKITELHTTHMLVLKAEDNFYDKFGSDDANDGTDYATIREDIGRKIDRIRAAIATSTVSGKSD